MTKTVMTVEMRQRRGLLLAPVVVLGVLTGTFMAFGGGRVASAMRREMAKGWDMRIPAAYLARLKKLSKLELYEQAGKDSAIRKQRVRIEDNYAKQLGIGEGPEAQVVKGLKEVERVMRGKGVRGVGLDGRRSVGVGGVNANIEKLERIVGVLHGKEAPVDPEMAQLSLVLDKLAEVQRVEGDTGRPRIEGVGVWRGSAGAAGISGGGFAAASRRVVLPVSGLRDADDSLRQEDTTVIEAVVAEDQLLVSGGELRMELARDVWVGGQVVASGTPVYGVVSLSGERLRVSVTSINNEGRVLPVNLVVADQDGFAGIYIPGAPVGDAVRESADQDIGMIEPAMLSTTLAGQAANAGFGLARSLISKKVRPVKVRVPAGYRVILHEQKNGL